MYHNYEKQTYRYRNIVLKIVSKEYFDLAAAFRYNILTIHNHIYTAFGWTQYDVFFYKFQRVLSYIMYINKTINPKMFNIIYNFGFPSYEGILQPVK